MDKPSKTKQFILQNKSHLSKNQLLFFGLPLPKSTISGKPSKRHLDRDNLFLSSLSANRNDPLMSYYNELGDSSNQNCIPEVFQ